MALHIHAALAAAAVSSNQDFGAHLERLTRELNSLAALARNNPGTATLVTAVLVAILLGFAMSSR